MKSYVVAVKIRTQIVRTVVDAENPVHAELLAKYRFGISSLVGRPVLVAEGEVSYPLLDDVVAEYVNLQSINPIRPKRVTKTGKSRFKFSSDFLLSRNDKRSECDLVIKADFRASDGDVQMVVIDGLM